MRNISIHGYSRTLGGLMLAALLPWCASADAQPQLPPPSTQPAPIVPPPDASPPAALTPPPATSRPSSARSNPIVESSIQPGESVILVSGPFSNLQIRALETRILELGNRIKIVDGFDQTKINITALSPHRIRLHAEQAGVTTVKLIDEFDNVHQLEVFVEPDTRELKAYLDRLFPDTSIMVVGIRDGVVLRGSVTQPSQIPQIISVAEQFYPVVQPQLTVSGPNQVQLHVKVIEVQRTKLRELGFNFFIVGRDYAIHNGIGALSQVVRQGTDTIVESPSNLRFSIAGNNMAFHGFLQALQQESLAKILAEPVLVTTSGRPATVRSGGSFPIPVSQGLGAVSIEWRDFGVTLEAVPII
ncbi:MAG TPA: hypothetical protein VNQ76_19915, partial [Planctomicrobium sp.]|nr:hypothetical protein [Planctomicrobium sp.]